MPVPVDTRHIEAILALAEELSFTRAATKLRLGQPSLSRQIEQLEGIVGFPICDRSSRHVIFTEAGQELVDEFRRAAQHIKLGIHRGQMAHEGKEHILLIGHSPYIDPHLLSLLFEIRLPQFPKFRVETDTNFVPVLVQKLLDGAINLAFVTCPTEMETVLYTFLLSSIIPKRINLDSYRYREARYHPRRRRNDPSLIWTIREVVLYFSRGGEENPAVSAAGFGSATFMTEGHHRVGPTMP